MQSSRWIERVADFAMQRGCLPHGKHVSFQIHHVVGRKGKHNKVKIGEWFILPIQNKYHDVHSNDPLNVTHFRHRFTDKFGLQCDLFRQMCEDMVDAGFVVDIPNEVLEAIMDTQK